MFEYQRTTGNFLRKVAALMALLPIAVSAQTNSPGNALVFNGVDQDVTVPNQAALNAFPMTAMCWFKTTNTSEGGVVNKYFAGSLNGYSIIVQNGRLQAWYFAGSGASVGGSSVLDGGAVNDGNWHHAALAVDATGGRLYLDGTLAASQTWSGTPGPTTTTQPIYLGDYPGLTAFYQGEMDEISLWSVSLSQSQIQTCMNRSLAGTEPNLVAYWRLDEGSGSTTADNSGNGNTGSLAGSPDWTNSDAPVGIVPPAGFSQNWTHVPVASAYSGAMGASADGINLVYVSDELSPGASVSTNGGASWQPSTLPAGYWDNAASSADGTILYGSQSTLSTNIFESTDSGATWNPITTLDPNEWCVACSANGGTIVAASQTTHIIAVSTNFGATWVSNLFSSPDWHGLTCSSDGTHMAAVAAYYPPYYSADSGATWNPGSMPDSFYFWSHIAGSADGRVLITGDVANANPIFQSTNFGATWRPLTNGPSGRWYGFASSADGTKLIACGPASVYVSVDSGQTWQASLAIGYADAAISADGTRTVVNYDGFYLSLSPPTLAFASANATNLVISWPNPSTGFTLQQSATPTGNGWTNTPIRPAVAASQNQVTLTNVANQFFRLAFP